MAYLLVANGVVYVYEDVGAGVDGDCPSHHGIDDSQQYDSTQGVRCREKLPLSQDAIRVRVCTRYESRGKADGGSVKRVWVMAAVLDIPLGSKGCYGKHGQHHRGMVASETRVRMPKHVPSFAHYLLCVARAREGSAIAGPYSSVQDLHDDVQACKMLASWK